MSDLMMYIGIYILMVVAVFLTVGFAWFLIVGRALAERKIMYDDEWTAMKQRIKKKKELNGRATKYEVDLAAKEGRGGWTGKPNGSDGIKSNLSDPHPFYSKGRR